MKLSLRRCFTTTYLHEIKWEYSKSPISTVTFRLSTILQGGFLRKDIYQASGQPAHHIQIAQGELMRNETPGKRQRDIDLFCEFDSSGRQASIGGQRKNSKTSNCYWSAHFLVTM